MKFNKSFSTSFALTIGASLIVGCAQNNSNTPQVTSSFKMTGTSTAATVAKNYKPSIWNMFINTAQALVPTSIVDSNGSTITLSSAWTVIKEVEFKSEETTGAEDNESEIEFKGPYFVDLLSNSPITLDTQSISQKNIKRIKMKLEATQTTLPSSAPAGLANNSIYIAGSIGGNNFKFQLDDGTEVQIAGPNGFQPSENSELLVEVQIANIFKQIDMSSITNNEVIDHNHRHAGVNLCPSIDTSSNDLYTCIRKGLEKHADFGIDRDGDDTLENFEDHVK